MERRRTRLRVLSQEEEDKEEEEEDDCDRRISPRKRQRVRYIENYDNEVDDEEDDEEEEEDEEDDGQPGLSTQSTHNKGTQGNRCLPVTCGNKKGILDVEKLECGEKCIEYGGNWFSPTDFEDLAGKGSSKKWKASIFYENKPLQFWFEQGSLTTRGFNRRGTKTTKLKKIPSSDCISVSSTEESETQSAKGTQEDDVSYEDWLPGSEKLALEGEEERVGAENGGEVVGSGDDESKEEGDKMEKGEMGDEDVPADKDDNSVCEDRETKSPILTSETIRENALQKKAKVIITRLPETEDIRSTSNHSADLSSSAVLVMDVGFVGDTIETGHCGKKEEEGKKGETGPEMQRRCIKGFENEHLDMSRSEAGGQPFATGHTRDVASNTLPIHRGIKEESAVAMSGGPPSNPLSVLAVTDATTSCQNANQDTGVPRTTEDGPSSRPSLSGSTLDTMDLDQLRREKIKMQLKVLKLQEEYYTQKIEGCKQ